MDVIFARGQASAAEIQQALPNPPSYSTVRTQVRVLEEKGFVVHSQQGPRYLYSPTISPEKAKTSALKHLLQTFFDNSAERIVSALLDLPDSKLSDQDLDRLSDLIEKVRQEGK
jgi:predicted transcriptional regulator